MAEKSKTVHVVELHAKADQLEKAVKGLRDGFSGMKVSPDMEKILTKLESSIASILQKTKDGVIPRDDFAETERDLKKVKSIFDSLAIAMQNLQNADQKKLMTLIPEDTKAKLNAASAAYVAYAKVLGDVARAEQLEAAAIKKKTEAETMAQAASRSRASMQGKVTAAETEIAKYKDIADALREQTEAAEALAQAERELEEARTSGKGEKAIANRQAKVEAATGRKTQADTKVEGLDSERVKGYTAAKQKQTTATERYNAALREEEKAERSRLQATAQAESATEALRIAREKSGEGTAQEVEALAALRAALAALNPEYKNLTLTGDTTAEKLENLGQVVSGLSKDELQKLKVSLEQAGVKLDNIGDNLTGVRDELDKTKEAVKENDEAWSKQQAFENRIKQFLGLQGAAQVLRRALKDAIATIKELDATMTEMAVVTDLTVGDYWDQLPEYSKQASELGVSINSAYKAATLYYQQGLKGNAVTKISAETLKMAKIAGLDAADATDKMTAALRGFNMELNETSAQRISDVYSELAAITAADVSEISSAMTKTASIASNAGMEFETTAAFLSQIIETTRESAETAGTAMKTIVARFQELKKDPAEIGEVDGEIVNANQIEGALRSVGVALRDSKGQFRELDEVFLELSSKWDGLDKNTQRYIATIAAGSRQQSRFIAMMSNYSRTQELVAAANNSAGASQKQFEKTTESLQYKVEKLKNAWHEFTMGIMNSDLVKIGVDIATKFLEILNKATSGIDGLGGSVIKIMSILGIFKMGMKIFQKFRQPLVKFFADVVKEARKGGEAAGKAFDEGSRKGATSNGPALQEGYTRDKNGRVHRADGSFAARGEGLVEERTGWKKFGDKTIGLDKWQAGRTHSANIKKIRTENAPLLSQDREDLEAKTKIGSPEEIAAAKKSLAEYDELQNKILTEGQQKWKSYGSAISQCGQTISTVGMAMSSVGAILSELGLEEAGEMLTEIGGWVTVIGGVISAIGVLVGILGGPVTAILIAIIALWVAVAVSMKKASPEYKLEQAREATNRAQQAADAAKESYDGLASALDSLGDKYKALDELTVGTKEWTQAMLEANQEVLDLTEKYPELMEYVQTDENGVLRLDTESDEVQAVLQQKQAAAMAAQNNVLTMKHKEAQAEADVAYSELSKGATAGKDRFTTGSTFADVALAGALLGPVGWILAGATQKSRNETNAKTKEDTEKIAKKIASGEVKGDKESIKAELEAMGVKGDLDEMAEGLAENVDELRKFGNQLNQNDKQLKMLNDSAAATARSMADTSNFTKEELAQSAQMVDGETYAAIKESAETAYRESYKKMDKDEKEAEQQRIIEKQYGEGAKLEDGKVTLNGETLAEDLTEEDIINLGIAQKATEDTAKATEISRLALDSMVRETGSETGAAIEAMFSGANGSELKYDQLDDLMNVDRKQLWESLTADEQQAFGGSYENFSNKFTTAITEASAVFEKASTAIAESTDVSYMTAGQLSQYNQNLEKVKGYYDGEANSQKIQAATSTLLSGKDEKTKGEIQSLINAADWSNTESLLALQLKLETQYGYTTEEAKQYVETLGEAAYATSSLTLVIDKFGDFYQASKKLSDSLDKLSELQWEYNYALEGGAQAISENLKQQADEIQKQFDLVMGENGTRNAALSDFSKKYAEGMQSDKFGADLSYFVKVDDQGNIDDSRFQEYLDSVGENSEAGKAATQWLEELKAQKEQVDEQTEAAKEAVEKLDELQDQVKQSYIDLIDVVRETIVSKLQEQINVEKEALDATKQANSNLISKIQEQIDDERQARQNEEAEKNIQNQQSQLSYLMMDTSGANTLQAQNLEKNIQQAEQDYRDSLIDQTIQSLTDANEKAAEQRERQIALSEQQLTIFTESAEFARLLNEEVNGLLTADDWTNTQLGQLIIEQQTLGQTSIESQETISGLNSTIGSAKLMALDETYWTSLNSAKTEYTTALNLATGEDGWKIDNTSIAAISQGLLRGDLESELSKSGLSTDKLKDKSLEQLQSYKNTIAREGTTDSIASLKSSLGSSGSTKTLYDDAAAYYNSADFDGTKTYEEYLTGLKSERKAEIESSLDGKTFHTANRGLKTATNNAEYQTMLSQYEAAGGTRAQFEALYKQQVGEITSGSIDGVKVSNINSWDRWETATATFPDGTALDFDFDRHTEKQGNGDLEAAKGVSSQLNEIVKSAGTPQNGWLAMHNNIMYVYFEGAWRKVHRNEANSTKDTYDALAQKYKTYLNSYKTGGIADFTGPAWLDGTPSRPEYVLNSAQTERFFSLVDVLENYKDKGGKSSSGDNYFEIEINVEKLENDYDVEQIADKIRRMIYEDASYRNTNAINHIR